MSPEDAARFGAQDRDGVMVRVGGGRGITFDDVLMRLNPQFRLDMHTDTDEANAADLHTGTMGAIIKQPTLVKPEPDD
jgi:propanediol utilization protein